MMTALVTLWAVGFVGWTANLRSTMPFPAAVLAAAAWPFVGAFGWIAFDVEERSNPKSDSEKE